MANRAVLLPAGHLHQQDTHVSGFYPCSYLAAFIGHQLQCKPTCVVVWDPGVPECR
jgi:hypothetical protein